MHAARLPQQTVGCTTEAGSAAMLAPSQTQQLGQVAVEERGEAWELDDGHSRWIRVQPWNALVVREMGSMDSEDEDGGRASLDTKDSQRQSEALQDRRLATVTLSELDKKCIPQDVRRTRSEMAVFREARVQDWLQRCVSLFCQERGLRYAQGISELAAPWALITDPPSLNGFSYRCFRGFVDRFSPFMFTTAPDEKGDVERQEATFVVLEAHLELFEQLLRYHDPALAAYIEESRISAEAYATPWFVTLFARQTPIPIILHLWQRLLEYGDPLLHQFLALAWLLSSRGVVLETPRDDVPGIVTKLRFQSKQVVDRVFEVALQLRRSTPRLFCDVLRRACYADAAGPEALGAKNWRVSLLGGLKATGIILVDAGQVAEILVATNARQRQVNSGTDKSNTQYSRDGEDWGGGGNGARCVLVDCRAPGDTLASSVSSIIDTVGRGEGGVARCWDVVWRRIDPSACFGKESKAVAELLHEFSGVVDVRTATLSGKTGAGHDWPGQDGVETDFAKSGHDPLVNGGPYQSGGCSTSNTQVNGTASPGKPAPSSSLPLPYLAGKTTHVCFIGTGNRGSSAYVGSWNSGAEVAAAAAAAACPAYRFARAASRCCMTPRVCVLDGGFSALSEAVAQEGAAVSGTESSSCLPPSEPFCAAIGDEVAPAHVPANASDIKPCRDAFAALSSDGLVEEQSGSDAAKGTGTGTVIASANASARESADEGASASTPATIEEPPPTPSLASRTISPSVSKPPVQDSASDPTVVATVTPPTISPPFSSLERKASKLASRSRISEPFRAYAANRSDDVGRALRSLPAAAGKPLEDAARVCNSLAKSNVKTLGDSRLSLTRSLTRLEQLDARMGGTARGFARHFGAGVHRN